MFLKPLPCSECAPPLSTWQRGWIETVTVVRGGSLKEGGGWRPINVIHDHGDKFIPLHCGNISCLASYIGFGDIDKDQAVEKCRMYIERLRQMRNAQQNLDTLAYIQKELDPMCQALTKKNKAAVDVQMLPRTVSVHLPRCEWDGESMDDTTVEFTREKVNTKYPTVSLTEESLNAVRMYGLSAYYELNSSVKRKAPDLDGIETGFPWVKKQRTRERIWAEYRTDTGARGVKSSLARPWGQESVDAAVENLVDFLRDHHYAQRDGEWVLASAHGLGIFNGLEDDDEADEETLGLVDSSPVKVGLDVDVRDD